MLKGPEYPNIPVSLVIQATNQGLPQGCHDESGTDFSVVAGSDPLLKVNKRACIECVLGVLPGAQVPR